MKRSESITALVTALASAQALLGPAPKNREVSVSSKRTNTRYTFRYTTLDALIEHVRGPLTANGLWFTQTTAPMPSGTESYHQGATTLMTTTLLHRTGEWIATEMVVPEHSDPQEFGSELTYRKRYALAALLGVGSDDDDDGNEAADNDIEDARDTDSDRPRRKEAPEKTQTEPSEKAVAKAKEFVTNANAFLDAVEDLDGFEAWAKKNRAFIASLRAYDKEAQKNIIQRIDDVRARLTPGEAHGEGIHGE